MAPLARAHTRMEIGEQERYRIAIGDATLIDQIRPGIGTLAEVAPGLVIVTTNPPERRVDVTVEEWPSKPPLRLDGDWRLMEVVENSATLDGTPVLRLLTEDGSEARRLELTNPATGPFRIRLYTRSVNPVHAEHLLRLWPAATARKWIYQLDEDGQPVERPDRSATETLSVMMTAGQANTIKAESQEMAILEAQSGDVDDIVEDCLQIRDLIPYYPDPAPQVTVALTVRQWRVALAVLDHRSAVVLDSAEAMSHVRDLIDAQIGDHLPPGRVHGS